LPFGPKVQKQDGDSISSAIKTLKLLMVPDFSFQLLFFLKRFESALDIGHEFFAYLIGVLFHHKKLHNPCNNKPETFSIPPQRHCLKGLFKFICPFGLNFPFYMR
jgi:hypothetical protein